MLRKFVLFFALTLPFFAVCDIIKKPPPKPVHLTWNELACSEQDRMDIYEIVSTVAEKNKLSLLFQQNYLREKGAQVNHVHPLKFLGVIFSNPHLKTCMFYIWDDYFKRTSFMADLAPALTREADKDKLQPYLQSFCKEVGAASESVKGFFESRDWDGFVLYLIHS
ncbi:MAG: hypothetical protein KGQ49_04185 [Verrucomicrobia bacterium]|nr:hypothetical protein [Verrucomicrobiota bacterium]MBU6446576.1 hypothetical protein [Verrucomicrobiota bacterium]MDE3048220.1 hypothetical protein [Verrucomicrobiota bacterium]